MRPKSGWAAPAAAVLLIGGVMFVGSRYTRPHADIQIQGVPSASPAASSSAPSSPPASLSSTTVTIDVEGAVKHPGVQKLPADSRVQDAITAAGGQGTGADTSNLNLAAKLTDGTQVYIPQKAKPEDAQKVAENYKGGADAPSVYSTSPAAPGGRSGGGKKHPSGPVSLNTGSESQLESLPGVGPSTAKKILEYRREHGGFSSIEELLAVKGIGPKKLAAMRQWLRL